MSVWPRHLEVLAGILFPSRCLGCDRLFTRAISPLGLCRPCLGRIRTLRPPFCRVCARPLSVAHAPRSFACLSCRDDRGPFDRLIALWRYEPPVPEVVQALKFSGRVELAAPLGALLAERVHAEDLALDAVAPVPLHWRRRLRRGYDQAEALAEHVAARLGLEMIRALRRVRPTRPQSRLHRRERPLNVRSAFRPRRGARIAGRHILLVDDVVTSTATLRAAATALSRHGAGRLTGAVIARTPKSRSSATAVVAADRSRHGRRFL